MREPAAVIWHDLECGAYGADLDLWAELSDAADGAVLDLGCGSGRVALHLAGRGHEVIAVDRDEVLIAALRERAAGLAVRTVRADVRLLSLGRQFDLVLAPMQLAQLLDGDGLDDLLVVVAAHLRGDGLAALAVVEALPPPSPGPPLAPDALEVDGWVYSSLPLETGLDAERLVVRRLRQTLAPDGALSESLEETALRRLDADRLERAAAVAGLRPAGRRTIAASEEHVGSTVVLLGREA